MSKHVIYLTTAMKDEDFDLLVAMGKSLNPAGQNFHSRLIAALEGKCDLSVVSIPPAWDDKLPMSNGVYSYIPSPNNKFSKYLTFPTHVMRSIDLGEAPIIVYDSMNYLVASIAGKLSRSKGLKKIAVLTDNPNNITGVSSNYVAKILKESKDANGYIALSSGLIETFEGQGKPHCIFEGILDGEAVEPKKADKPYFYFGGALYEKYGIKAMVSAFMASKADYVLVIAGHGPLENELKEAGKIDTRIHYLGQISKTDNAAYEKGASLLINPRPYSLELDKNSVPSKLIEFLYSGSPIVSTTHSMLKSKFPDQANWLEGKDVEKELFEFLKSHLDENGKLKGIVLNEKTNAVISEYGKDAIGDRIKTFLEGL